MLFAVYGMFDFIPGRDSKELKAFTVTQVTPREDGTVALGIYPPIIPHGRSTHGMSFQNVSNSPANQAVIYPLSGEQI